MLCAQIVIFCCYVYASEQAILPANIKYGVMGKGWSNAYISFPYNYRRGLFFYPISEGVGFQAQFLRVSHRTCEQLLGPTNCWTRPALTFFSNDKHEADET